MGHVSFIVELDKCRFLSGSNILENESFNYPGTLQLDDFLNIKRSDDSVINLVCIHVTHEINGEEYHFISPPYSTSIDDLSIRIEFLKSIVVNYYDTNPRDYFFEMKL